jgi:RNA polymerase sigma-70 factor (ECF subfamily)
MGPDARRPATRPSRVPPATTTNQFHSVIGPTFGETRAAAQLGEHDAIETIYRDVAPLVVGYLRSVGAYDAEDIASDVFISMLRALPSFTGDEQHFRSWLLTIAHRRYADAVRASMRRRDEPVPLEVLADQTLGGTDVESEAIDRLRATGVLDALDRLTPDQRSVLMLRILADRSVAEIAVIVDKPETAVKALLRRGTAALNRLVAEPHDQPDPLGPTA